MKIKSFSILSVILSVAAVVTAVVNLCLMVVENARERTAALGGSKFSNFWMCALTTHTDRSTGFKVSLCLLGLAILMLSISYIVNNEHPALKILMIAIRIIQPICILIVHFAEESGKAMSYANTMVPIVVAALLEVIAVIMYLADRNHAIVMRFEAICIAAFMFHEFLFGDIILIVAFIVALLVGKIGSILDFSGDGLIDIFTAEGEYIGSVSRSFFDSIKNR